MSTQGSAPAPASSWSLTKVLLDLIERGYVSDRVVRAGIRSLNAARLAEQEPSAALREQYKLEYIDGLKKVSFHVRYERR